ncbi:hypothetical protein ACFVJ8_00655 [Streptomyces yangpuensis]|uniref:hypothetical protein n=1 Tax=Streptomyces yangpuensis TaxID=1648182 RepID=UPI0036352234
MHVFVNRVDQEGRRVVFRCKAGHGYAVARWMGDALPPQGTDAFVELTVPAPVTEWVPASPTAAQDLAIGPAGVVVTGEVLGVGGPGDPVVELRVGTGVVLVEVVCDGAGLEPGRRISFVSPLIEAHPYEL